MTEEGRSLGGRGGGALGPRAIPIFPSRAEPFFCYPAPASLSPLARRRDWAKRFPRERDLGGGKESSTFERWGLKEQPARAHPLFLIPLPHRGRGSRRRPERSASGVEGRGGRTAQAESKAEGGRTQRLEVAPAAPLTLPSPPQGERERRTRIAREDDRSGGTAQGHGKAIRAGAGMALINGRARPDCAWRERRAPPRAHLRWRAPRSPA